MQGKICKNCKQSVASEDYFCPQCGEPMFEDTGGGNVYQREGPSIPGSLSQVQLPDWSFPTPVQPATGEAHGSPPGPASAPTGIGYQTGEARPAVFTGQATQSAAPEVPQAPPKTSQPHIRSRVRRAVPPRPWSASPQPPGSLGINPQDPYYQQPPPSQYGQPPQYAPPQQPSYPAYQGYGQVAGAAMGQISSREQLRRLIEEDKRKRKKLLLIGIPSLIVVGIVAALLLVFFVFGGGLTPEQYKKQAGEIHDDVVDELRNIEHDWDRSDVDDKAYSVWYSTINEDVTASIPAIQTAEENLNKLKPPKQTELIQAQLGSYYQDVDNYLARAVAVFSFAKEWARIWEQWVKAPYAIQRLPENATPGEYVALVDEDIRMMQDYVNQFKALAASDDCKNMQDGTIAIITEGLALLDRFRAAVIARDMHAYESTLVDYDNYCNTDAERTLKLWDDLHNFRDEFWDLIDKGQRLQEKLAGTGSSEQATLLDRQGVAAS